MSKIDSFASRLPFWIAVSRLDRPAGWIVLLWPTWIALTLAASQADWSWQLWAIFTLGVITTRSAGCVINDLTDRKFDCHVKRTKNRPLTSGNMEVREGIGLAVSLLFIAFGLVLLTNIETIFLSVIALGFTIIYPWLKRVTYWPQIGLGLAFSMAIPMAYSAHGAALDRQVWFLFAGNVAWTLSYDTFYAMVDRDDDLNIGVKSTAILFGRFDLLAIAISQFIALICFSAAFSAANTSWIAYLGIAGAVGFAIHQQIIARQKSRDAFFQAFLESHRFGAAVFAGVLLDRLLKILY
jgi:4-hydroxybenzoate polyprenyltransferase